MSWATCYMDDALNAGSNNIHSNFPPIMHDGRNYADWQPGAYISDQLRKQANITSNWQYRNYLVKNADTIVKMNQLEACDECCGAHAVYAAGAGVPISNNSPYLFQSVRDNSQLQNFGYENSDLKNLYLADTQLESRMVTPVLTQAQLLQKGFVRAN